MPYKRLSIVRNPDGFLTEPSVQRALTAETGILFVTGSPFELRLHFELSFKEAPDTRFCYICENPSLLCGLVPECDGPADLVEAAGIHAGSAF